MQHIPVYSTLEEPPAKDKGAVIQQAEEAAPPPPPVKVVEPPPEPKPVEKVVEQPPASSPTVPDASTFKLTIKKTSKDEPLGLDLDVVGSACAMVIKVTGGSAGTHNKSASPELQIQPGDFIMSVNGVSGDTSRMAQETNNGTKLEIVMKRPVEFIAEIDKASQPGGQFGIGVDFIATGRSVLIKKIDNGLIASWNKANPEKEVKLGDRIVGVNSFRGDPEKMLDMAAKQATVAFRIVRV